MYKASLNQGDKRVWIVLSGPYWTEIIPVATSGLFLDLREIPNFRNLTSTRRKGYLTFRQKMAIKTKVEAFCKCHRYTYRSHQITIRAKVWITGPSTRWVRRAARWTFMIYPRIHFTTEGHITLTTLN